MTVTETAAAPRRSARAGLAVLAFAVFLAGCAEEEVILPGKREPIREDALTVATLPQEGSRAISLPAATANTEWTQSPGSPDARNAHPALGTSLQRVWSADIGEGDSRRQRITANPVVALGQIFTLDAESRVTAISLSGQTVWATDIRPRRDSDGQATGGGLAFADGRVFVSSGYGTLVALDAVSGELLWRQRLEGTGSGAPSVSGGLVYLTSGDDTGWAVSAEDGRVIWQLTASPDENNVLGAPAPAIAGDLAIFGFGSGEIQAVFRRGGLRRWDASVVGERFGRALSNVGDVTGAPVIAGNSVYVGNQSGRIVSLNLGSGERRWTARDGATGPVQPAGDSIFAVSDLGQLVRIDSATGERIWAVNLPGFVKDRPNRRAEIFVHHGPILAGGRIHLASSDGLLRSFDPVDGTLTGSVEIPGGATSAPVVAGNVLYVVSTKGELHAFR
ncbi:PQQ-binding-like beta-propeller repeat protein [uncultured Roseobacter sp.]|uniref:PQQ-like beta-propeller repeat protein n=1 Tax=uncultured Roseobacter sp. TaxID=114847 RepID=UPI00262A1172|nr:PQQ-binding-like beta-propeller repeat protein [uncultured Roseobacter sp.]